MILIYVRHYLNSQGMQYFETTWFPSVLAAIKLQPGFISIDYERDKNNEHCMKILLKFNSRAQLEAWACTSLHDQLVDNLDEYRIANWQVATVENSTEEQINDMDLNYEYIIPRTLMAMG